MIFDQMVSGLLDDTLQMSLPHFAPELTLCATIVVLLLVRIFGADRWLSSSYLASVGTLVALLFAYTQFDDLKQIDIGRIEMFTGLLVYDKFTVALRLFLLFFTTLVISLTMLTGIPDKEDGSDFYTLLLGSTIGMMLMVSANHLLMLFLAIEMTSVPSYVMVGFLKGRRVSGEAAFKYVIYGAGVAGVMLYGISLLMGILGTGSFPLLNERVAMVVSEQAGMSDPVVRTLLLGILMVLAGLAFKLSAFPFHFWCPDAFEGAPAEVAGFLSVASKAAAFALLLKFILGFVSGPLGNMADIYMALGLSIGVVASVTATFGNLAAYAQTNIKRMLAYSTIAHAGYMLMAVAAMIVILTARPGETFSFQEIEFQAARCVEGLLYYLAVYLFMNLGAFAVVALIRNEIYSEEIEDYNGLATQMPALCLCMLVCLFSLVGMPPLGGFVGKFMIFAAVYQSAQVHWFMWVVLGVGAINTVFSLFYYLRVLKAMYLAPRPEEARLVRIPRMVSLYAVAITVPVVLLGFAVVQPISAAAIDVAAVLLRN